MTGDRFVSIIETGVTALLVTLALVAGYIILRRMARQMRKGVDLATSQSIDDVEMRWKGDGTLYVRVQLPQGMTGRLSISIEAGGKGLLPPAYEVEDASGPIEINIHVPIEAEAIVVQAPSEKLYRPLPRRN